MAKKKATKEPEVQTRFNDLSKIYFYIRDHKKLNPIPWKWNLNLDKIKKIKAL